MPSHLLSSPLSRRQIKTNRVAVKHFRAQISRSLIYDMNCDIITEFFKKLFTFSLRVHTCCCPPTSSPLLSSVLKTNKIRGELKYKISATRSADYTYMKWYFNIDLPSVWGFILDIAHRPSLSFQSRLSFLKDRWKIKMDVHISHTES